MIIRGVTSIPAWFFFILNFFFQSSASSLDQEQCSPKPSCTIDEDCSLNGVCTAGSCVCYPPYGGKDGTCGEFQFKPITAPAYEPVNEIVANLDLSKGGAQCLQIP